MENFALIDAIRSYCLINDIVFIYGNEQYANAEADAPNYKVNQKVLVADFNAIPTIEGGRVQVINYQGVMMLGQKLEALTKSNLNEKPIEKYDRRLKTLTNELTEIIGSICCRNELEVSNINIKYDLNKFDVNIDFVACSLTFIQ